MARKARRQPEPEPEEAEDDQTFIEHPPAPLPPSMRPLPSKAERVQKTELDWRTEVGTGSLAALFNISSVSVLNLTRTGVLPSIETGRYNLFEAAHAFVAKLKEDRRERTKGGTEDRVRIARAREIEVRTDERLGRLVAIDDFDAMIDAVVGGFRAELSGLPSRVTRDLALRRVMEREIHGLLQRVTLLADQQAARLETGLSIGEAEPDDDAGSMGGGEPDVSGGDGDTGTARSVSDPVHS